MIIKLYVIHDPDGDDYDDSIMHNCENLLIA